MKINLGGTLYLTNMFIFIISIFLNITSLERCIETYNYKVFVCNPSIIFIITGLIWFISTLYLIINWVRLKDETE